MAEQHYAGKLFYESLLEFIGGPLVAEGENAIAACRQLAGATNPVQAATGSVRDDPRIRQEAWR